MDGEDSGRVTETPHLTGPEHSTEAPCPNCNEPVSIDGIMFPDDDAEVEQTCHWCQRPYVVRRRTHFVGYTLTALSAGGSEENNDS